jgi:hypothetical protein
VIPLSETLLPHLTKMLAAKIHAKTAEVLAVMLATSLLNSRQDIRLQPYSKRCALQTEDVDYAFVYTNGIAI